MNNLISMLEDLKTTENIPINKPFVPCEDDFAILKTTHRNGLRIKLTDPLKWKIGLTFPIAGEQGIFEVVSKSGNKAVIRQRKAVKAI